MLRHNGEIRDGRDLPTERIYIDINNDDNNINKNPQRVFYFFL